MNRLRPLAVTIAIAVVAIVAYSPAREAGFIQDDHPIVELNPVVHRGKLSEIFTTDYWAGVGGGEANLYRPVTILSFALQRGPDGLVDAGPAHAVNVVLHALCAVALYALSRRLGPGAAASFAGALLFAAHPVHVAAVLPLVGRADILALLFLLLAMWFQTAAGTWPVGARFPAWFRHPRIASWAAGGCLFLALASKEIAVAGVVVLTVLEVLYRGRNETPARRWLAARASALAPSFVAVASYLLIRTTVLGSLVSTQRVRLSENPLVGLDSWERTATALAVAGRYVVLLLFPFRLSADYSGNVVAREGSLLSALPFLGLLFLAAMTLVAISPWVLRRSRANAADSLRPAAVGAVLYLAPYAVIGNLFVLVGVIMAERLIYLPSAGLCLIAAAAIHPVALAAASASPRVRWGTRVLGVTALVSVVVVATWRTRVEGHHWRNEEALFSAVIRSTPESPRAHFTLGMIRLEQGRSDEAFTFFENTLRLWPTFSAAWFEKGRILVERGRVTEAAEAFRRAAEINPGHAEAQLAYGMALNRLGRLPEAERQLEATLRRFPGMVKAAAEYGHVLMRLQRYGEAASVYRQAIRMGRTDLEPQLRSAETLAGSRGTGGAISN